MQCESAIHELVRVVPGCVIEWNLFWASTVDTTPEGFLLRFTTHAEHNFRKSDLNLTHGLTPWMDISTSMLWSTVVLFTSCSVIIVSVICWFHAGDHKTMGLQVDYQLLRISQMRLVDLWTWQEAANWFPSNGWNHDWVPLRRSSFAENQYNCHFALLSWVLSPCSWDKFCSPHCFLHLVHINRQFLWTRRNV